VSEDRITTPDKRPEDIDAALRPKTLAEFIGQAAARDNLRVFIEAAKGRGQPLGLARRHWRRLWPRKWA
jgi:holliday junction DNA helicase RuvB